MKKRLFWCVFFVLIFVNESFAGATDTYGIGARSSALGGAVSAWANDPFAVHYNPAGLSLIDGGILSAGANFVRPDVDYYDFFVKESNDPEINTPSSSSDDSDILTAPALGYAQRLNDTWAMGISAYAPWGLDLSFNDNPADNPAAYDCYKSGSSRKVVTPGVSYKINGKLSIGFGVTLGSSTADRTNRIYLTNDMGNDIPAYGNQLNAMIGAVGVAGVTTTSEAANTYTLLASDPSATPEEVAQYQQAAYVLTAASEYNVDHATDLDGMASPDHGSIVDIDLEDSFNYSFNVGVLYRASDIACFGLTYRSRADTTLEGDVTVNGSVASRASMDYTHPDQIQAGVRFFFPNGKLSIETDAVWTNWSLVKDQVAKLDRPIQLYYAPGVYEEVGVLSTGRNWNDTFQLRIGIEYLLNDMVTLRLGHFYDPTPAPDQTIDLQIPDSDKRTYSAGLGIRLKAWTIDTYASYTDIEQDRYIGGESTSLNASYSLVNADNTVTVRANGSIFSTGVTLSYSF